MPPIHIYYKTPLRLCKWQLNTGVRSLVLVFWENRIKQTFGVKFRGQVFLRYCDCRAVALCLPSTAVSTMVLLWPLSKGDTMTSLLMQWATL